MWRGGHRGERGGAWLVASAAAIALVTVQCSLVVSTSGLSGDVQDASEAGKADADAGGADAEVADGDADVRGDASNWPPGTVVWPTNGHGYLVVVDSSHPSWSTSKSRAESLGGHLVTLSSDAENQFVYQLTRSTAGAWYIEDGPWIGGFQPPGSPEPAGGWTWVTGEPWSFTAWLPTEPSNSGDENRAQFYGRNDIARWNDNIDDSQRSNGFVVEFE